MRFEMFLCYDCAKVMRHGFETNKLTRGDISDKCAKCGKKRIGARYEVKK